MATTRRSLAGPSLPETINPFTQERIPAYLVRGANPFTNNLNAGIEQAQHNFAGPGPAALTATLRKQGLSFGALGSSGSASRPGGRVSLAAPSMDGGDDAARSGMLNAYLSELADENAQRPANAPLDAVEEELREMRARSEVKRASAIANDPNVSARGRDIVQRPDGGYETGAPTGEPVNRQAIAAQMAPGLIAPPPPEKPVAVTYGAPKPATVNGKKTFIREGSDGFSYDMGRRKLDPAAIGQADDAKADYTLDGVRYDGATNKPIAGTPATGGQPTLSATQRDELAVMDTVQAMNGKMLELGKKLKWEGTGGMGYGSAANFIAKNFGVGSPEAQELRSYIGNIKGTIAKLRGGTAFSANEEKLLDTYTPGIDDSPMVIQSKTKLLDEFINAKRTATRGSVATTSGSGGGTIRAIDPDGNVHEAKAGTPLPQGWKLEGG